MKSHRRSGTFSLLVAAVLWRLAPLASAAEPAVWPHPSPAGEPLSERFAVQVMGKPVPVRALKVAAADPARRWKAMDDKKNSGDYFDWAAFASFDFQGTVRVVVTCPAGIRAARVAPASLGITPVVDGRSLSFSLAQPAPLTIEVDGDAIGSLHLFANTPETDAPRPGDPGVIYYGPGVHEVGRLVVDSGKTLYLAAGAVLRCVVREDEKHSTNPKTGLKNYGPAIELRGERIAVRGRGMIDGSRLPTHARQLLHVRGRDILVEGITLHDSPSWNMPIRESDRVTVRNVKILGRRANSDGIDICNSRDVLVERCFLRTLDDLVVVKSDKGRGDVRRILVRQCVLWNEVAHALSVGAELREPVDDVRFVDCDVIRDRGREWTLRVYHCDGAPVSNITFEDIRVEESKRLASVWIGQAVWSRDAERGRISGVRFARIQATADPGRIEIKGFDATHRVEAVTFEAVTLNGVPLAREKVVANEHTSAIAVRP
jgi:hypothetical protein